MLDTTLCHRHDRKCGRPKFVAAQLLSYRCHWLGHKGAVGARAFFSKKPTQSLKIVPKMHKNTSFSHETRSSAVARKDVLHTATAAVLTLKVIQGHSMIFLSSERFYATYYWWLIASTLAVSLTVSEIWSVFPWIWIKLLFPYPSVQSRIWKCSSCTESLNFLHSPNHRTNLIICEKIRYDLPFSHNTPVRDRQTTDKRKTTNTRDVLYSIAVVSQKFNKFMGRGPSSPDPFPGEEGTPLSTPTF